MAVSVRTASGTPSSSLAGRSSRVHTVDEVAHAVRESPPACRARTRCATSRCGRCRPGGDTGARVRPPPRQPRQRGVGRQHGGARWPRPRATAGWRFPPIVRARSRTPHAPAAGIVGGREHAEAAALPRAQAGGAGQRHCAPATASSSATGRPRATPRSRSTRVTAARRPGIPSTPACSTSCRTACRSRCRRARSCSRPAAS